MMDDQPVRSTDSSKNHSDTDTNQPDLHLIKEMYQQLRSLAGLFISQNGNINTLQPTVIVHEAYMRLAGNQQLQYESRAHFFHIASKAMRHVIVDHTREKHALKRGGNWNRVTLDGIGTDGSSQSFDAQDIHEALTKLESLSSRQSQVVELRFFGGLKVLEIAQLLDLSEKTIQNEWRIARAWLCDELNKDSC